jgi:hypothetical protein
MKDNIIRKSIMKVMDCILSTPLVGEEAQKLLISLLEQDDPVMIARFGSTEIQTMVYSKASFLLSHISVIKKRVFRSILNCSGFFPVTEENVAKFGEIMCDDMTQLDCLGSWRPEEIFFRKKLQNSYRIKLGELGPITKGLIWSKVLKGKKVLVVSPFAETIEKQYHTVRDKIWGNPDTLPQFESLQVLKAVQSLGGESNGFRDWFEALDYMKGEIDKLDFDIALIGCGAYGFPLAAHVKRIGKKSVHIGGSLQLYFGIKGKRWEGRDFINQYFVSPAINERPEGFEKVEGGCYW